MTTFLHMSGGVTGLAEPLDIQRLCVIGVVRVRVWVAAFLAWFFGQDARFDSGASQLPRIMFHHGLRALARSPHRRGRVFATLCNPLGILKVLLIGFFVVGRSALLANVGKPAGCRLIFVESLARFFRVANDAAFERRHRALTPLSRALFVGDGASQSPTSFRVVRTAAAFTPQLQTVFERPASVKPGKRLGNVALGTGFHVLLLSRLSIDAKQQKYNRERE